MKKKSSAKHARKYLLKHGAKKLELRLLPSSEIKALATAMVKRLKQKDMFSTKKYSGF